jgi:hypothetical protein
MRGKESNRDAGGSDPSFLKDSLLRASRGYVRGIAAFADLV